MKLILILLISIFSVASDFKNISLLDFTSLVSKQTNKAVYIDKDINSSVSLFVPNSIKENDLFKVYKSSLQKSGLFIKKVGSLYYISSKTVLDPHTRIYTFKYNSFNDVKQFLDLLQIKYKYLQDINTIVYKADLNTFNFIKHKLSILDIPKKQVYLKIMIFEFKDDKLKDIGIQSGSIYKNISNSTQYALNSIVASISTISKPITSFDFYSAVHLLQKYDYLDIKQNPFILAKHNKKFSFEAVTNIPYLVTTTKTQATNTSEQNNYEYKDVGLKINGKAFIYKTYVSLDLNLIVEDILDSGATPTSFKRSLTSNTNVKFNDVLILSGIKKSKNVKNNYSVPFLSNIPYLGKIFQYHTKSKENTRITIAIQVLHDMDVASNTLSTLRGASK